jgi:hypothetical protein
VNRMTLRTGASSAGVDGLAGSSARQSPGIALTSAAIVLEAI